ncbi:hypothetical protein IAT40_005895 [Kwoniella sp. CBS 6097]
MALDESTTDSAMQFGSPVRFDVCYEEGTETSDQSPPIASILAIPSTETLNFRTDPRSEQLDVYTVRIGTVATPQLFDDITHAIQDSMTRRISTRQISTRCIVIPMNPSVQGGSSHSVEEEHPLTSPDLASVQSRRSCPNMFMTAAEEGVPVSDTSVATRVARVVNPVITYTRVSGQAAYAVRSVNVDEETLAGLNHMLASYPRNPNAHPSQLRMTHVNLPTLDSCFPGMSKNPEAIVTSGYPDYLSGNSPAQANMKEFTPPLVYGFHWKRRPRRRREERIPVSVRRTVTTRGL